MVTKFHKNKIYRVNEKTDRQGNVAYKVESVDSFIDAIFGLWSEYEKENKSLDDAIMQIEFIDRYKLKNEKIVHKEIRK